MTKTTKVKQVETRGVACLEIAVRINEKVLWLEVAVDEVQGVQVLKRKHDLRCVEPRMRLTAGTVKYIRDVNKTTKNGPV